MNMYKILLLLVLSYNTLLSSTIPLTVKERNFIQKHPTIVLGTGDSWEPYVIQHKDGSITGYDNDILTKINKLTGANFIQKPGNWIKIQKEAKNKQIDGLSTLIMTNKRKKFLNFSDIYISLQKMVMVQQRNPLKIYSSKDLNGKTIVINKGNAADEEVAKKFKNSKIIYANTPKEMLEMVIYGKADATFGNGATEYMLGALGLPYMEDAFSLNKKLNLRFAVRKDWPEAISIINKALAKISQHERILLQNKWFGYNIKNKKVNNIILTKDEKLYLKQKKEITMCIDPDWMPFESFKDGKYIGMTADYFKIFEHNLGYKIKLIPTQNWTQSLEFAKKRRCDILSLAMETPKRKKYMNFTSAYLKVPLVLATKNDKHFVNDFASLGDKKVGIPKGYAFIELLKTKYPNLNIIEVKNIDDGLEKVTKGELYGYVGTLSSVGYAFQNKFVGELKIAGKFDEKWGLGVAVRNDDLVLLDIFEKLIKSVNSVQSQKILNNWLVIKYEKQVDYKFLWEILFVVSILIIFFLYRQYVLKESNQNLQIIVENKTKDLQILNENLEIKIAQEVEKNLAIQEKLFNSEKLSAMGEMIGNIAHQWRQPLSVISTAATGMQMQKEYGILTDEILNSSCEAINNNAQYLSKTIDDFKNFIKGDRTKEIFNLKTAIDGFLNLMKGTIKANHIDMILDIDDTLEIDSYENELKQCLINIFNNAKDVLKEQDEQNRFFFITIKKDITNDCVTILLKDSGGGVPENIKAKIFDPYFTTKHKSQGTGLGLNMAYKMIIEGMNGAIEVNNRDYEYMNNNYTGAEFKITLPFS